MKRYLRLFSITFIAVTISGLGCYNLAELEPNGNQTKPQVKLRSSYKDMSASQVQSIPNISIRKKRDAGFYGHSTINHNYERMTINGDIVVIDNATGLMWHQSGSDIYMTFEKTNKWLMELNSRGYAGYHDWRLPTVEDAASLLESSEKNGYLYIDPVFDKKQSFIWTGDKKAGSRAAWRVDFRNCDVYWCSFWCSRYVRPVRSGR